MPGHRKPQQLPPPVTENKKCEELLKGNRRNYKQINRRAPAQLGPFVAYCQFGILG
jgi:hypothetical protein